jgi:hypothetical protein
MCEEVQRGEICRDTELSVGVAGFAGLSKAVLQLPAVMVERKGSLSQGQK